MKSSVQVESRGCGGVSWRRGWSCSNRIPGSPGHESVQSAQRRVKLGVMAVRILVANYVDVEALEVLAFIRPGAVGSEEVQRVGRINSLPRNLQDESQIWIEKAVSEVDPIVWTDSRPSLDGGAG